MFLNQASFGFENKINSKKIKEILHIKTKEKPKIERMVETKEEYEAKAKNVPLEERELPEFKPKESDDKYIYPKPEYIFEKYNYPPAKREVNIDTIKKDLVLVPFFVADNDVQYGAYVKYYFNSNSNQISSNLYVEKLDETKSKKNRILQFHEEQEERKPILEAGTREIYPNLYRGLNIVDWSKDGKKLLVKEKVGSLFGGIYKTYLYIYFLPEIQSGKLIKLENFDEAIREYYLNWEKLQLVKYRYDIIPVGFSAQNEDVIIVYCYLLKKTGEKVFLGTWGYNYKENLAMLFSKTEQNQDVEANGLILIQSN